MRRGVRVSIGLPVFNGENYIRDAIDALLDQTFTDFELIISDNASTDRTREHCLAYAAADRRIRYVRNDRNIGGSANYGRVFALSSGEYFQWAAHDDVCRPEFLARCVEALQRDPSVVLAYPRTRTIDAAGTPGKKWEPRPGLASPVLHQRFREALRPPDGLGSLFRTPTFPLSGLIRSSVLARTLLFGRSPFPDLPLLAELCLYGPFHEVPEFLFFCREHQQRSMRADDELEPRQMVEWSDPTGARKVIFPVWRLLGEFLRRIHRAPIGNAERRRCYARALAWAWASRQDLARDLMAAGTHLPAVGPLLERTRAKRVVSRWLRRHREAARDIEARIPAQETVILADECSLEPRFFTRWRTLPFTERDGQYWGPPPDDAVAIHELDRLRRAGAHYIVFGWTTFWWLDFYAEFHRHLRSRFPCTLENDHLVVFDLRHDKQAGLP